LHQALYRSGIGSIREPVGSVLTIYFELAGQKYLALNGGPEFQFTPAISLMIDCKDQAEVDYFWEALSAGGLKIECGWVTDKFGISWQIVPSEFSKMMLDEDTEKNDRVMAAMLKMKKLEIEPLRKAYAGE
jgi:predicted 3-demethylubiquinone-9 3-methyltransferase (glyoxalase superfamily)